MKNRETVLDVLHRLEDKITDKLERLDQRLDQLEKDKAFMKGVVYVIGLILGVVTTVVIRSFV